MKRKLVVEKIEWVNGSTYVYYDLLDVESGGVSMGTGSFHEEKYVPLSEIEQFVKDGRAKSEEEEIEIVCGK